MPGWFAKLKPNSCVTGMDPDEQPLSPLYHSNLIIRGFHAVSYRASCIGLFHFSSPFHRVCSPLSHYQRAQICNDYAFCSPFSSPPSQRFSLVGTADAASRRPVASNASHCCLQAVRLQYFTKNKLLARPMWKRGAAQGSLVHDAFTSRNILCAPEKP